MTGKSARDSPGDGAAAGREPLKGDDHDQVTDHRGRRNWEDGQRRRYRTMNILWGFAPYIVFFLLIQVVSTDAGLWAALIVAVLNAGRDWARAGSPKVLELGTMVLFTALAIFTTAETLEVDGNGSPAVSGCRAVGNRIGFARDWTPLHLAVRS